MAKSAAKKPAPRRTTKSKGEDKPQPEGARGKYVVFDKYAVTAILRWMGSEGYETAEAAAVLKGLGVEPSPTTISIQVTAGRKAKDGSTPRGPIPQLTRDEVRQLNASRRTADKLSAPAPA